ncbi:ABC transporter ATP-binding protein [Singulisphaera acidiphila]|uniref:ABC-type multidrug transport system, ATPase component n=1 Tax=Singulisphaera acidiphila (strain ATCC BAA-1392 / DSM 18658 / VKM B-2454 / MOB10) TaxID=886293 RepID=L0DHM4_SINAD|nr:ABC transporter ATP-binding protein [Singulisphaera acidiphila]AGA28762.1 ABC-type multidrug transport system, ATPase component [Singulisphaera acidiphila DSM 18658]
MIRVRDLRIDYDSVCAVSDLSLEVGSGEVCGLIGPNGAGKTTTMKAILGLIEPTYGEIELAGVDMRERPRDACRVVGFMPDFPPMYDDLMCWEFLDLFAASYFIPRSERPRVIDRSLALVGLTEKRRAMVVELSRGMRQRLMLAKTLIPDPQVLMLDEPASGLDPQGRIDLKNVVKGLAAEKKTVLISSHILSEMSEFCTSVAIMERGRMVVSGTIAEIQERIMGGAVLLVEVLGDSGALTAIVESDPLVESVEQEDGFFSIRYRGDSEQASDLLAALVRGGVRVASFARRREGLEELFLKVGAKDLS